MTATSRRRAATIVGVRGSRAVGIAVALAACPADDDDRDQADGGTTAASADDGDDGDDSGAGPGPGDGVDDDGADDDTGPTDCVEGAEGCACLDGGCAGTLFCVDDVCVRGPDASIDEIEPVIAGLRVPIEAEVEGIIEGWAQTDGPAVEILGEGPAIEVNLPPDLRAGAAITIALTLSQNGVTTDFPVEIAIREPVFEDFLPMIDDPEQIGRTEALAFNDAGMWVGSMQGFVSLISPEGTFLMRHDVGGTPVGGNFLDDGETLLVANEATQQVQALATVSGAVSVYLDALDGGGPLGTANYPLVEDDGSLFLSNRESQQVIRYDAETDSAVVFVDDIGVNPNAIAFGPDPGVLYVGVTDRLVRVPILDGGVAGEPADYLDLAGACGEIDGIAFDDGGNVWVGCPLAQTLFVARWVESGPTEPIRSWTDVGGDHSWFVNVRFGNGDFGDTTLYWTNLDGGTVGRLAVGLGAF